MNEEIPGMQATSMVGMAGRPGDFARWMMRGGFLPIRVDHPSGGSTPLAKGLPEGACEDEGQDEADDRLDLMTSNEGEPTVRLRTVVRYEATST